MADPAANKNKISSRHASIGVIKRFQFFPYTFPTIETPGLKGMCEENNNSIFNRFFLALRCSRSTKGSQKLASVPKRHNSSRFLQS